MKPGNSNRRDGVSYAIAAQRKEVKKPEDLGSNNSAIPVGKNVTPPKEVQTPPTNAQKGQSKPKAAAANNFSLTEFISKLVTDFFKKLDFNQIIGKFMSVLPEIIAVENLMDKIYLFINFVKSIVF